MQECDGSLHSGQFGYDPDKAFKPYRTGSLHPERTRVAMIHEQTGIDTSDQLRPKPKQHRPDKKHAGPHFDRGGSQASSYNGYDSDDTIRPASPLSSESAYSRKPSSNRPQSPAPSASSQRSRSTIRRIPIQDQRPPSPRYAQTLTSSGRGYGAAPLSLRQPSNYNKAPGQSYDSSSAHFRPRLNGSSTHRQSRRASSPQGPGKGPTPLELQRRMGGLSVSGQSDTRRADVSGIFHPESLVSGNQLSTRRFPTDLSRPSIDPGPPDMREQMGEFLRPIRDSVLPFVQPKDYILATGAAVIAEQKLISRVLEGNDNSPAYPRHAVEGSSQRSDYADTTFARSSRVGGHRRLDEAPPHGGYDDFSERSAGSRVWEVHGDLPSGRYYNTQREPSFRSQQSAGYPRQSRTANSLDDLQLEPYQGVPQPPLSQRSTHRPERPAFRDFEDQTSRQSTGTRNLRDRGPLERSYRGGLYPGAFDEDRY